MGHQIEILREEAQTLLKLEQNLLLEMAEKCILDEPDQESDQDQATLDTQSVKKEIAVLRGEVLKVIELEMVLAVVGTMKAGKSTTINAIVGKEILPNRNAPMTAIPTLIKHCKGKNLPHLIFTDTASSPINQLIQDLKVACENPANKGLLEQYKSDNDLYTTIEKIQNGMKMRTEAFGEEQIFDFLSAMNDLVRIAPLFNLQFPFEHYQDVDQLPVIEVEFAHLQEMEDQGGKLILLDTPGPNEAGQTHLRPMLQDQLKKASAVLVVMDYTQLKSEADAQVRDDLKDIANTVKNRIYALVNKFDNCDRNGMQQDEVKTFVEGLTEGLIKQENTYPVAAKFAYLANRARHERLADGLLPDIENAAWVDDFYQEAGLRRASQRTVDRVAESIEDLWSESLFSYPLKEVIEASHQNAVFVALDSAVDKLDECSEKINTVLSIKSQAINKTTEELQFVTHQLEQDIQSINTTQSQAKDSIESLRNSFLNEINQFIESQFDYISKTIIQETSDGNKLAAESKNKQKNLENKNVRKGLFKNLFDKIFEPNPTISIEEGIIKYDMNNPIIDFGEDKELAEKYLNQLGNVLPKVNKFIDQEVENQLDTLLEKFETEFKESILTQAYQTLQQVNQTMNTSGFDDIQLTLPNSKKLDLKLSSARVMQNILVEKNNSKTRSRVVDSYWGKFKNILNDDWGREEYTVNIKNYTIDMNEVSEQIQSSLKQSQNEIQNALKSQVEKPLQQTTAEFFSIFRQKVLGLKNDINISLKAKQQSQQNEIANLEIISSLQNDCQNIKERTRVLKGAILESLN